MACSRSRLRAVSRGLGGHGLTEGRKCQPRKTGYTVKRQTLIGWDARLASSRATQERNNPQELRFVCAKRTRVKIPAPPQGRPCVSPGRKSLCENSTSENAVGAIQQNLPESSPQGRFSLIQSSPSMTTSIMSRVLATHFPRVVLRERHFALAEKCGVELPILCVLTKLALLIVRVESAAAGSTKHLFGGSRTMISKSNSLAGEGGREPIQHVRDPLHPTGLAGGVSIGCSDRDRSQ